MNKWLFVLLIGVVISCQKAQRDEDRAVNTSVDISLAQTIFGDAYKHMRFAALNTQGISDADSSISSIYGCETIVSDTTSNPKTIIIDYKFLGCEGIGAIRQGRLLGDFHGKFGESGSAVDIKFNNYFFEDFEINGSIRVIFEDPANDGNENHSFYLQNGSIYDGSTTMSWTASQHWTVSGITGAQSYSISGTSNGVNRKGNVFKSTITVNNLMSDDCLQVTSGNLDINVVNLFIFILFLLPY